MSEPTTEQSPPKPRRRWLMPVLFISLALNLLVIGAVVGRALSPDGPNKRDRVSGQVRSVIGEPFVRALSREDRVALLADLMEERPRIRENRESLRTRFEAFLSAVRRDPFNVDEVRQLMAQQRGVAQGRQELGEQLLIKRLEAMSAAERAEYADRLEDGLKNFRKR